jgi:CRP/FNR family transcriptional regulator, cyclic AMP receptor protein
MRIISRDGGNDLEEISLFEGCPPKELKGLTNLGTRLVVPAGQRLVDQGARGTEVVVVVSGRARCSRDGADIAQFGPGDFFGEVAVLDGGPRTATVVADTDMELLVLDCREFELLLETSSEVGRRMVKVLASRLRSANTLAVA